MTVENKTYVIIKQRKKCLYVLLILVVFIQEINFRRVTFFFFLSFNHLSKQLSVKNLFDRPIIIALHAGNCTCKLDENHVVSACCIFTVPNVA